MNRKLVLLTVLIPTLLLLSGCDWTIQKLTYSENSEPGLIPIQAFINSSSAGISGGQGSIAVYMPSEWSVVNLTCTGYHYLPENPPAAINWTWDGVTPASITSDPNSTNAETFCGSKAGNEYTTLGTITLDSNGNLTCDGYINATTEGSFEMDFYIGWQQPSDTTPWQTSSCDNPITISTAVESSSSGRTRYIIDANGNLVGTQQGQQVTFIKTSEPKTPYLSIGGGTSFDIKAWWNDIVTQVKEWFVQ